MILAKRLGPALLPVLLLVGSLLATPWLVAGLRWVQEAGPAGHAVFAALYLGCTLVFVPASILEASAGFLYGPAWGVVVASTLGTLGGCASFLLGRTLLRARLERRIAADPRWTRLDRALGEQGPALVFWLRLSPLAPFNTLHVLLGTTSIRLRDFAAATLLGHLLPVVLFAWTGSTVESLTALAQGRPAPPAWGSALGLVATVLATLAVTRIAKRAVDRALG